MLLDQVSSDLHHRVKRALQDLLSPITDQLTRCLRHFLFVGLDQLSQLRRVVLQVQVGQQRHVENSLSPDAAVTVLGLSSATEPSSLDVWKNVSDDLPKVGGAERTMLQVLAVSLVCLVDILFGQAGVRVLLQVTSDPVTRVKLVGCVERAGVPSTLVSRAGS